MKTIEDKIVLEWIYKPQNFIEGRLEFSFLNGSISAEAGTVNGEFECNQLDAREFRSIAHEELEKRFLIYQLVGNVKDEAFELSQASMYFINTGGNKSYYIFAESGGLELTSFPIEFKVRDKSGKVAVDTWATRQKTRMLKIDDVAMFLDDPLLKKMLQFYHSAKIDRKLCLFHLYAIFQAAELEDKGFKWIPQNSKKILNQYPNNEPFFESRHAGEHPKGDDKMRHLSKEDTDKVFDAAAELIMAYVDNLKEASLST